MVENKAPFRNQRNKIHMYYLPKVKKTRHNPNFAGQCNFKKKFNVSYKQNKIEKGSLKLIIAFLNENLPMNSIFGRERTNKTKNLYHACSSIKKD